MSIDFKQALIENIIKEVRDSLRISEIIGRYVQLKRVGGSYTGLCPFHNDHKVGAFMVNDGKKIFKCFSCETSGDVIKFHALINGINYVDSAIELAYEHSLITQETYNQLRGKTDQSLSHTLEKKYIIKQQEEIKKADEETLHKIYSLFIKGEAYIDKDTLKKEHKEYLLKRGLSEEDIKKRKYFTFPSRYIIKDFLREMKKQGIPLETLKNIPGFYYDYKKESWSFSKIKGSGIGIPIMNEDQLIVGIQIRRDTILKSEGEQRYIWFSSAFARDCNTLEYGISSGSPLDLVYPDKISNMTIFVTEGHFKAVKIAKEYHSVAISVQGVSSWRKVIKMIKTIKEKIKIKHIYIAYDADMSFNINVLRSAIQMGLSLYGLDINEDSEKLLAKMNDINTDISVSYCLWNYEMGKGIDDAIGNKAKVDKMALDEFYPLYLEYLSNLNEYIEKGIYDDIKNIPAEEKCKNFQNTILSELYMHKEGLA